MVLSLRRLQVPSEYLWAEIVIHLATSAKTLDRDLEKEAGLLSHLSLFSFRYYLESPGTANIESTTCSATQDGDESYSNPTVTSSPRMANAPEGVPSILSWQSLGDGKSRDCLNDETQDDAIGPYYSFPLTSRWDFGISVWIPERL